MPWISFITAFASIRILRIFNDLQARQVLIVAALVRLFAESERHLLFVGRFIIGVSRLLKQRNYLSAAKEHICHKIVTNLFILGAAVPLYFRQCT